MRKYQQKKILKIMSSLYGVIDEIHQHFINRDLSTVIKLLIDCQNAVVQIGEFIEKLEGDDTQTVKLLTNYHKSLYDVAVVIETTNVRFTSQLKQELNVIEESINNELKPNKIEVAFFPYKASMWDSLESIWLAAKEDPECDAYVVPIPYFDRLPGGELGRAHYEGDQFPEYVPIVNWKDYNMEQQRPDISFIHNAFDSGNVITTVHPDYYSNNLNKYTELLCYSPYFVTSNEVEQQLTLSTGLVYSDKIFVQSDRVREAYVNAIQAYEEDQNCVGGFGKLDEKIVASGSPKFDKIINSRSDDFTLPDEWKKFIVKSDGSWKKIVLYNTSVGPILKGNEKYIAKLRSVFDTFRNHDDVVLWWRPHPLSEATYSSMRPLLFNEYTQLIQEYKLEGYGIYDDSADLHRALNLSSAFYGDATSLMPMYQCMPKPLMVQNEELSNHLTIGSICDTEEYLYFLTLHMNGFFRLDKNTWNVEHMGNFVNDNMLDWRVYHSIHQSGNKLYFSPHSAGAIAVYDITESAFDYIDLPAPKDINYNVHSKFSKMIECESSLYFIPLHYPGIVKLNMEDHSTEIIDDWVDSAKAICLSELGYFTSGVYDEERGSLLLAFMNADAIMDVNIRTKNTNINILGNGKYGYSDIILINSDYWLLSIESSLVVKFNIDECTRVEYRLNLEGVNSDGFYPFQKLVYLNEFLYLVPVETERMVKFDIVNQSFSYVNDFCPESLSKDEDMISENAHAGYYYVSSRATDDIYVTEKNSNRFIQFNPTTGAMREESITLSNDSSKMDNFSMHQQVRDFKDANSCVFWEHPYFATLENLLQMISKPSLESWVSKRLEQQAEFQLAHIAHADGNAGIEIYEHSKKAVLG
ncbi:hypothetical protein SAMN05720606_11496 [Paenibacillus polysaccharolyticus]|uniref:CDP-Glycerol:Poly(Glycerophosphate) glycerophosphotransferase n=1 Tax=Paenibacillus polysaccharolyticus TaxID=582692 RepID=A0A1G5KDV5_9BACL|nr:hypothetical protein [Paenibacillus polysaccharolyticus]SCY98210.1 hypothetical protein SAMN05720606_11496 [Paenibacillus polysaccharolyticus]